MASNSEIRKPNEYFRYTIPEWILDDINKARDDILGTSEERYKKYIGKDGHITVRFVGNQKHLTADQIMTLHCFESFFEYKPFFRIKCLYVGDVSPVVFLVLVPDDERDLEKYVAVYKALDNYLKYIGIETKMNVDIDDPQFKIHITLTWADDRAHAEELLEKFQNHTLIKLLIDHEFQVEELQLFHNDGEVISKF